jgi:hypothetical protein
MSKNKKQQAVVQQEDEPSVIVESQPLRKDMAVSIIPRIKNKRVIFEVVRFSFDSNLQCSQPEVIHTTINEATAITLLFQTAHETLGVKELRQTVRKLKGEKHE